VDYKHIGFSCQWQIPGPVGGFVGECHNCRGVETILLSGLARNIYDSEECGKSAGVYLTKLYALTRVGPPCRGMELDVYNPNPEQMEKMGIKARAHNVIF